MNFIELTATNKTKILVNLTNVLTISTGLLYEKLVVYICFEGENQFAVMESYEDVKEKINKVLK